MIIDYLNKKLMLHFLTFIQKGVDDVNSRTQDVHLRIVGHAASEADSVH